MTNKSYPITRHILTNKKTGEVKKFVGGLEVREKAVALFSKWFDAGIPFEWESEPVEVCPTCGQEEVKHGQKSGT